MKFYVRLIMRINLTCILLFSVLLQVSASGLAQRVSISKKNISLQQLFIDIQKQTGYDFLYEPQMLYFTKPLNLNVTNAPLKTVLDQAFAGEPLTYTIDQKTIVVKRKEDGMIIRIMNYLASINIEGRVADERGMPLIGASVRIKGTPKLVITNSRGEFVLRNVDDKSILQVSSVGYKTKEVKAEPYLNVALDYNPAQLDSVSITMSTGYQTLNKERSTGSAVVVTREELNRRPNGNIIDRIADIVPGFLKTNRKEQFSVRGISSINGNKQPLIVLDDFPYPGDVASINRINPNDIESVTVLKDAAAASIWGAQAGNGVIVITTRKGKYNRMPQVSFNTNVTISDKQDLYSVQSISSKDVIDFERMRFNRGDYNTYDDDYPKFKNFSTVLTPAVEVMLAARSGKITKEQAEAKLAEFANHDVRDDINKYFLRRSLVQQYAFNISGGGPNYNYYASLGYDKNQGSVMNQGDDRLSINYNNSYKPLKNLEINAFIGFTRSKANNPLVYGNTFMPVSSVPYMMLADANGKALAVPQTYRLAYVDTAKAPALLDWHYRPLDELNNGGRVNKVDLFRIGGSVKYTIIPGLTADLKYQYQSTTTNNRDYKSVNSYEARNLINNFMNYNTTKKVMEYPVPIGGIINFGNIESVSWNLRGSLNYNRKWGSHEIVAIAGSEIRQNTDESRFSNVYGFNEDLYTTKVINPDVVYPTRFGSGMIGGGNSISGSIGRFGDYFSNAAYTFRDRYTVSASGRIDQSNFYGLKANMRKAPLWSAGVAWNALKEDFVHINWLSNLRLRTTFGYNGNTNGGTAYPIERYAPGGNIVGASPYAELTSPGNPELRWEKVKITNFAVEAASKNGRITGSFEYYLKDGIDLISAINLDPTTGVFNFIGNKATIKAHGYDFNLNTVNLQGAFRWNTSFILSYNIDKVVAYDQKVTRTSLYTADEVPVIGQPLYKISSYRWAGLDPKDGTPRVILGDTISSYKNIPNAKASDVVYSGSTTPRYAGSIINTFTYKQISLSVNINFRFNYVFRKSTIDYANLYANSAGSNDYAKRWQKPGDELYTYVPALPANVGAITEGFRAAQFNSDNLVEKGDHIRLQDVRLGYNLSRNELRRLPFQSVQFYFYTNNLGILWRANKSGLDPDAPSFGSLRAPKTYAFGLNVNF